MSMKDLKKYASTKHESLPVRVKEELAKIDGRSRMFKEKVRKLYYEKIKKNEEPVEEAEKKEAKKNKITIDPELKEHKGVSVADIPVEDAYSIRCTPQFVGPTKEAVARAHEVLLREYGQRKTDKGCILTEATGWDTIKE